jgi:hypothetical protein
MKGDLSLKEKFKNQQLLQNSSRSSATIHAAIVGNNFKMVPTWLIYHPTRQRTIIRNLTVYHDKFGGNEDPYIWHDNFLHTYCHITQLTNVERQINFWVSGDTYPDFTQLFCDCVFVVKKKCFWIDRNHIDPCDPIVDNHQTFKYHYNWVNKGHHKYKKKRRYTLKADSKKSFQPQDGNGNIIDILPFLNRNGITTNKLISSITSKCGSRPLQLNSRLGHRLYDFLVSTATIKLFGRQLKNKHPNNQIKTRRNC